MSEVRIVSVWVAAVLAACLAWGCGSSAPPRSMTPAQAEKVLVSFRPATAPVPPRTIEDVALQVSRDNATYYNARNSVMAMTSPNGASNANLAEFYHGRAMTARAAGFLSQWASESKLAADLVKGSQQEYFYVVELSYANMYSANPQETIAAQRRLLAIAKRFDSPGMLGNANGILALTYAGLGNIREARRLADVSRSNYNRARASDSGSGMWRDAWDADSNLYDSAVLAAEGQLMAAEAHARAALAAQVRYQERMYRLIAQRKPLPVPPGWVINQLLTIRIQLAYVLARQGRYAEAEVEIRQVLPTLRDEEGSRSPTLADLLTRFSRMLVAQGRFPEAVSIARAAVRIYVEDKADPRAIPFVDARRALGSALVGEGSWSDALEQYDAIEAVSPNGYLSGRYFVGDSDWALALLVAGQTSRARTLLDGLVKFRSEQLGPSHYDTAEARALQAAAVAAGGQAASAVSEMRDAFKLMRAAGVGLQATAMRTARMNYLVEAYLSMLMDLRGTTALQAAGIDATEESFQAAELARAGSVPRTVAAAAARSRTRDPRLGELARAEQDSHWQIAQLETALVAQAALPKAEQSAETIAALRSHLGELTAARAVIQEQIARNFPDYAELIKVSEVKPEQIRRVLAQDEALVAIFVGRSRSFLWVVSAAAPARFESVPLDSATLVALVGKVRAALDLEASTIEDIPAFDLEAAYALYERLLLPVAPAWKGARQLIVVPHRELARLPLALLPTRPAAASPNGALAFAGYRSVNWLTRDYALSYAPSAGAFIALRAVSYRDAARRDFAGIGDPYFSKAQVDAPPPEGVEVRAVALRDLTIRRVPPSSGTAVAPVSNSSRLAQVPRLPDTATEIRQIAAALSADPEQDVFLGERANEAVIKDGTFENRRIVAFATHGLVAGDLDGLDQPALALSAPEVTGHEADDGLLTMEEILGLKFQADWIVLSACNTAAGSGAGAEAISGLGRAFFYAGARSLLVSHWAVESTSAMVLTVDLFKRQAAHPALTRAEALRETMVGMIDRGAYVDSASGRELFAYAHPVFWAPFTLVGDGAR